MSWTRWKTGRALMRPKVHQCRKTFGKQQGLCIPIVPRRRWRFAMMRICSNGSKHKAEAIKPGWMRCYGRTMKRTETNLPPSVKPLRRSLLIFHSLYYHSLKKGEVTCFMIRLYLPRLLWNFAHCPRYTIRILWGAFSVVLHLSHKASLLTPIPG